MIEVDELTKRFGRVTAVDALSFTVRPGQVTGFLGPNGAGKTTTLRLLLGLNRPTAGRATINGKPFRANGIGLRQAGALLDAHDVHRGRSARAHLAALARSNGLPRARADAVLGEVGLTEVGHRRIGGFSLGMKQRLGIATALLGDPPTLLFDEPFNGLDPEGVRWARALFRSLAGQGRTVFVSSHLMSEMQNTAERLIVVGRGRLIADETVAEFAARSATGTVTVRTPDASRLGPVLTGAGAVVSAEGDLLTVSGLDAARIGELAFGSNVMLHEVATHTGTLEDAFMRLTEDSVEYRAGEAR